MVPPFQHSFHQPTLTYIVIAYIVVGYTVMGDVVLAFIASTNPGTQAAAPTTLASTTLYRPIALQHIPCAIHPTSYTLALAPYALHAAPYTLGSISSALFPTTLLCYTLVPWYPGTLCPVPCALCPV